MRHGMQGKQDLSQVTAIKKLHDAEALPNLRLSMLSAYPKKANLFFQRRGRPRSGRL